MSPTSDAILQLSGVLREHIEAGPWSMVWPGPLADVTGAAVEDVVVALGVLERQGYLTSLARVRCPDDHAWAGPVGAIPPRCPVCDVVHGDDTFVEVLYERKKKPRRRAMSRQASGP